MTSEHFDAEYDHVSAISITRENGGFSVCLGDQTVSLPEATNFEFRPGSPMMIKHLYLGSESGEGYACHVTFLRPRRIRLSNAAPRCYVYID
jgi:hypothetical protein